MQFDTIYINNCTGRLDNTVLDATSCTPATVGTSDIFSTFPTLLPPGNHPRLLLNGPCLWFESWSDTSIKDEQDHIEFYLYEVLCVWQFNKRYNSPIGLIAQDCEIKEFDMIETWCLKHNKTFSIYTNEYGLLDGLEHTRYADWPIIHLDTFSLCYGYDPAEIKPLDQYTIAQPIQYRFNCFTYRWDQHRMLAAGMLREMGGNCVTHYHRTRATPVKWPYKQSTRYIRLLNTKNALDSRVPLTVEAHTILAVSQSDSAVPLNPHTLSTDRLEPYILSSFASVVCETNYEYPWAQLSEKTVNAARFETPFLLLAGPRSLELCRQWGLKTFDQWWDESYDQEVDPLKRFDLVFDIIERLQKMSLAELTEIKADMKQTLLHNRNLFRTGEIKKNLIKGYK